jgi:hypothetical protein
MQTMANADRSSTICHYVCLGSIEDGGIVKERTI